jgi:hypothetical protein
MNPEMPPMRVLFLLLALAGFSGCGALSTHQSPRLMQGGEKAWTAGLGGGRRPNCDTDTGSIEFGNGCVLTLDPYVGWRWGIQGDGSNPRDLAGDRNGEIGVKVSGVPFLGGTLLGDVRIQRMTAPMYMSYDFGLSVYPCISENMFDDEEDASEIGDHEKKHTCGDNPFGAGAYAGFTMGAEWLHVGMKYGVGANTWDGLQLLPGINIGSALGPKGFKAIPAMDVYFYQWPMDTSPDLRILFGVGLQVAY